MGKRVALVVAAAGCIALPAQAAWYKAESPHFVVYADDSERDVTKFAEILERFHTAMRMVTGRKDVVPSPSNRVTIFAVGSESRVQQLIGDKSRTVAGFYAPGAGASRAFVPNIQIASGGENDFSLTVLLHEYAHHFLLSASRFAMPRWVDEGAAEFFASAKFERDGSVGIGRPAYHRGAELAYADDVTVEELLDHAVYDKHHGKRFDAFYGRAWGLYHYLIMDELQQGERKGQFTAYSRALMSGKSERDAATAAFGDLEQLEKDLDGYLRKNKMSYIRFSPERIPAAQVKTAALTAGEAAVMPLRIRSQRGVNREQALELVPKVREVAARYPQDAGVLTALAEAEHDAGNDDAAVAAADKAIALDPSRANAYVQKGYALFAIAEKATAEGKAAAFAAALKPFQALNKIENDHPLPLAYFYRSYVEQGRQPPELARHALERASELAPFDQGLTFEVAIMQAMEGKIAHAKANLLVLAANPHGGDFAANAQKLAVEIGKLAEGTRWEPSPLEELATVADVPDGDGEKGSN